jgi:hypothetical protein
MVSSDPQVTSHLDSELYKGRGRFRDPAPASDDDQDAGVGGSTALATACSPIRVARKRKRQSPASVEDLGLPDSPSLPGPQDTMTVERGRETSRMELRAPRRGLHWGEHATQGWSASLSDSPLQVPASLVTTHVTHLKRKSSLPRRRTVNSPRQSKTPRLQPVTKVDMTTVNQSAELQPVTLAPPFGLLRIGNFFSLQVTLVTRMISARMTASCAPTPSLRSRRPSGLPLRRIARSNPA